MRPCTSARQSRSKQNDNNNSTNRQGPQVFPGAVVADDHRRDCAHSDCSLDRSSNVGNWRDLAGCDSDPHLVESRIGDSMKEYLKMADVFSDASQEYIEQLLYSGFMSKDSCELIAHAVSSHDELVAEVERLRNFVGELERTK